MHVGAISQYINCNLASDEIDTLGREQLRSKVCPSRRKCTPLYLLFAVLVLNLGAAVLPADRWVSSDMGCGGWINQLRAGPSGIMLCNTDLSGTYISRNRGRSWSCIGAVQGLFETHASGMGFDPTNAKIMFIGTEKGIYRSDDTGESFTKVQDALFCTCVVISRTDARIGYATGKPRFNNNQPVFYRTSDNGRTWEKVPTNLPATDCLLEELSIDPLDPKTVYGQALNGRFAKQTLRALFKSADGGATWEELGAAQLHGKIFDATEDPVRSGILYASGEGIGTLKSIDGGRTWIQKTKQWGSVHIAIERPNVVRVIGAYNSAQSDDGGEKWQAQPDWTGTQFLPGHPWGGATTTRKNDDLSSDSTLFWRNSCYAWGSFDGGKTIDHLWCDEFPVGSGWWKNRGLKNTNLWTVAFSPADPNTLYAGFWDMGMWRSLDHGETWQSCNNIDYTSKWSTRVDDNSKQGCGGNTRCIAPDPALANVVWATIGGDQHEPEQLLKSNNRGCFDSWQPASEGLPKTYKYRALCVDPTSSIQQRTLYVSADGAVYKSVDGGAKWRQISEDFKVVSIAVDLQKPSVIYAGGDSGLYRSIDAGRSWASVPLPESTVSEVVVDPLESETVYVACCGKGKDSGLYRSADNGRSWKRVLTDSWLRTIAVDPTNSQNLYAGSSSAVDAGGYNVKSTGINVSRDGGITWHQANEGLSWPFANTFSIDPKDPSLVAAGVPGLGVQIRRFSEVVAPTAAR